MGPDIADLALLEDEDLVGRDQRREAMGNDDQRPAGGDARNVGVDDRLAFGVEGARRLVEDEDARIDDQRPGDGQPLALPAGKVRRAFVDVGLVAARQPVDELLGAGEPRRPHHVLEGRIGPRRGDVVADRAAEQEVLLQDDADAPPQMIDVVFADVDAVDLDQAARSPSGGAGGAGSPWSCRSRSGP